MTLAPNSLEKGTVLVARIRDCELLSGVCRFSFALQSPTVYGYRGCCVLPEHSLSTPLQDGCLIPLPLSSKKLHSMKRRWSSTTMVKWRWRFVACNSLVLYIDMRRRGIVGWKTNDDDPDPLLPLPPPALVIREDICR